MSTPKICPVLVMNTPAHMAKCRKDGCAWWDQLAGACCIAASVKKAHGSAANAAVGDGGIQGLPDTVSASHDIRETEDLQA